jgi:hypothetical protein
MKGRVVTAALSLLVAVGFSMIASAPADAATVPNRFYCNPNGGWCYQVNGAYHPEVGIQCQWKRSGMEGKPHQLYYTNCPQPWGPDVP